MLKTVEIRVNLLWTWLGMALAVGLAFGAIAGISYANSRKPLTREESRIVCIKDCAMWACRGNSEVACVGCVDTCKAQ